MDDRERPDHGRDDRERLARRRLDSATAGLEPPFAVLDMDALLANAADMVRRAHGKPIRVASKSIRCRSILERVLAMGGFSGIGELSERFDRFHLIEGDRVVGEVPTYRGEGKTFL